MDKRDRSRALYGYEKHAIAARAKSALKSGASERRSPPAVAALTIAAAILGIIIFAIPSEPVGKANAEKKTYHTAEP